MIDRQTIFGIALAVALIVTIVLMSGCAAPEQRWLTKEEDAELKANCEGKDCVVVPRAVLQDLIMKMQQQRMGVRI